MRRSCATSPKRLSDLGYQALEKAIGARPWIEVELKSQPFGFNPGTPPQGE
jgi:hypothetical protein